MNAAKNDQCNTDWRFLRDGTTAFRGTRGFQGYPRLSGVPAAFEPRSYSNESSLVDIYLLPFAPDAPAAGLKK